MAKRLLRLLRPAVDVEARPLPLPATNGGVGGVTSSDRRAAEPKVDDLVRFFLPIVAGAAGED